MKKLRIAITGCTGLIGRNLLFEIIKDNLGQFQDLEILVLGRNLNEKPLEERIFEIIRQDGLFYIQPPQEQRNEILENEGHFIKCLDVDLLKKNLCISKADFDYLKKQPIDFFFHVAASTDLRHGRSVEAQAYEANVDGTQRILNLVSHLTIREFIYVGTAYSCGNISGTIMPDNICLTQKFRNPYEKTKLRAEMLVREFSRQFKMKCRFFRPSVTCGRLLEQPLGSINKFDVFYGWGAFFLSLKLKKIQDVNKLYDEPVHMPMRILYNRNTGLNIVPCDFVAKVMYYACLDNIEGDSFHLVADKEVPHREYIPLMMRMFNITGVEQTSKIPKDQNNEEKIYYKTVGKIFTPYITSRYPLNFYTENLSVLYANRKLTCPDISDKMEILINYAKSKNFGVK